jgi:D-3-phosphoglycerate dehydrogenase / 2-oxoglutarate reductase
MTSAGRPDGSPIVIVSERLGPIGDEERRIAAAGADLRSAPLWSLDEIRANGTGARILLLGAVEPFDATALESLDALQVVVRRGIGTDNVDVDAATRLGILVANVPDASVDEVSDHALALLLAIERRIVPLDRAVHGGVWQRDPRGIAAVRTGIRRLSELTLGVVGFGRIGRALARKAGPIYRQIVVSDPVLTEDAAVAAGVSLVPLDDLVASADHISLHAPLIPATRHLLDDAALARLRPGAVFVNTSRGGLVDEAAVVRAFEAGTLRAAGLDVTESEPIPPGDPLLAVDGLVLTAHSAASSETAGRELGRRSVDAVVDVLGGHLPASVVNPEVLTSPALRASGLVRSPG